MIWVSFSVATCVMITTCNLCDIRIKAYKGLWRFPAKNVMKLVVTVTGWGVNPRYIFYVFHFIPGHVAISLSKTYTLTIMVETNRRDIFESFPTLLKGSRDSQEKRDQQKFWHLRIPEDGISWLKRKDDFQQVGFHGWNLAEALSGNPGVCPESACWTSSETGEGRH